MTDTGRTDLQRLGIDADELGRMRDAFASISETSIPRADCPDSDTIWAAARRELNASEVEAVVDHLGACGVCAEAWRIAVSAGPEPEEDRSTDVATNVDLSPGRRRAVASTGDDVARKPPWFWWLKMTVPLAATAILLVVVGLRLTRPLPTPTMRGDEGAVIASTITETSLPRDAFRLSWSPGPEGSTYELDVILASGDSLQPVATVRNLTGSSYLIPPEALATLPSGSTLDWQVVMLLPNGSRDTSATFTTAIR